MASLPPPLPGMPQQGIGPRPTGMLATSGTSQSSNPGGAITDALNNFITSYQTVKQNEKKQAADNLENSLKRMAQGIPQDHNQMAKWAKKADLALPLDAPVQPVQQPTMSQGQLPPGVDQMLMNGYQPPPPGPVQQQVPQAPPTVMQRIGQVLGIHPFQRPVSPNSAGMQWLDQFAEAGKQGGGIAGKLGRENILGASGDVVKAEALDLESLTQQQKGQIIGLTATALDDKDPNSKQAIEMLTKLGVMKATEEGIDSYTKAARQIMGNVPEADSAAGLAYLKSKMGVDHVALAKMTMAEKLMANFDGDLNKSSAYVDGIFGGKSVPGLTPHMSTEEFKTLTDAKGVLYKAHPTAPTNLIDAVAHAQLTGDKKTTDSLMQTLNKYPREGTLDYKKHTDTLGYDYANLAQKAQNDINQLNLGIFTELGKKSSSTTDTYLKLAMDPNSSEDMKTGAFQALSNSLNKDDRITIKYNGKDVSLGAGDVEALSSWRPWPMQNKNALVPKQDSGEVLNQFLTSKDSTAQKTSAIRDYAQKAASMPDGKAKLQALGDLATALQQVPKPLRTQLIMQLNLPDEMKPAAQQLANDLPASIQIGSGVLRVK